MERGEVLRSRRRAVRRCRASSSSRPTASSPSTARTSRSTNNIWLVGDDHEVLVIDAAHDARADRRRGRRPPGASPSCCTHGHNDHINAAVAARATRSTRRSSLHPDDRMLWDVVYPDRAPDGALRRRCDAARSAGTSSACCTRPATRPGGCCFHDAVGDVRVLRRHAVLRRPGRDRPSATATSRRSSLDHVAAARRCRPRRSCTPATATRRRSAPSANGVMDRAARHSGSPDQHESPGSCGLTVQLVRDAVLGKVRQLVGVGEQSRRPPRPGSQRTRWRRRSRTDASAGQSTTVGSMSPV